MSRQTELKPSLAEGLLSLYDPRLAGVVARQLTIGGYRVWPYLRWFWTAKKYTVSNTDDGLSTFAWLIQVVFLLGIIAQYALGLLLICLGAQGTLVAGVAFGLAVIVVAPMTWASIIIVPRLFYVAIWAIRNPKLAGKSLVCTILEYQAIRLRKTHDFRLVAVVGSVGKTSTKLAIASVLSADGAVRFQSGNYNDRVTVPLTLFGTEMPHLFNVAGWIKLFMLHDKMIRQPFPDKYVVLELGTDGPGQIKKFAYLQPDLAVVTAIAPEHMEYFGSLAAVAAEELFVASFSKKTLINADDLPSEIALGLEHTFYGSNEGAQYQLSHWSSAKLGETAVTFKLASTKLQATVAMSGKPGAIIALAAASVASELQVKPATIKRGLAAIQPFFGRMNILKGKQGSTIIDDTYNASPIAVKAGLDVLYATKASQRIAILGSMNELGDYAKAAHEEVGAHCDPKKLQKVVTIGAQAAQYLAPAAKAAGCDVAVFDNPYAAGEYVRGLLSKSAVVLAEGSQNGVFAEEAVKLLLHDAKDAQKLVRQSSYWLAIKRKQFGVQKPS